MKNLKVKSKKFSNPLYFTICCLTLGILLSACDPTDILKLDETCDKEWTVEVKAESDAYIDALTSYSTDPTVANCNEIKITGNNYIDALKNVESCVQSTSKQEWEDALEASKKAVNEIECN